MFNKNYQFETTIEGLNKHYEKSFKPVFIGTIIAFVFYTIVSFGLAIFDLTVTKTFLADAKEMVYAKAEANQEAIYSSIFANWIFTITQYFITGVLFLVMVIMLGVSILKGKKNKNFSSLPIWQIFVYLLITIFAISTLIIRLITGQKWNNLKPYNIVPPIVEGISSIVMLILYFIFLRRYALIRAIYINVTRIMEAQKFMQENPSMNEFMTNLSNLLSNGNAAAIDNTNDDEILAGANTLLRDEEEKMQQRQKQYDKLMQLPNEKLYEIAKALYISGYQSMQKDELSNLILNIFEQEKAKKATAAQQEIEAKEEAIIDKQVERAKKEESKNNTNSTNSKDKDNSSKK